MATVTQPVSGHPSIQPWMVGRTVSVGVLAALLALLTANVVDNQLISQDQAVLAWVTGWDFPGLSGLLAAVSFATDSKVGFMYGALGIAALLLLGKNREAIVFAVVGLTIAAVAILGDYTLGEMVGRGRPLGGADNFTRAFPSGHVFGSTVFFGFIGFLAVLYHPKKKHLVPLLGFLLTLVLLVGPSRVYEQAHWPTDVAAGYLLGGLWLLLVIPAFMYVRSSRWMTSPRHGDEPLVDGCDSCRTARSIASVVALDPERGTATKVYRPPLVVRLLYWLAFQARFPYVGNAAALRASAHRRKVAGLLTTHRFGKDLVAPVLALNHNGGQYELVTEFVPGELAQNDEAAKGFLAQVSELFAAAGLAVWQVNPHNPHAHTNLISTSEGDFNIIDLESSLVTPFLPKGQRRNAFKAGNFPVFDDVDFLRMRAYVASNAAALETSLGVSGLAELADAVDHLEEEVRSWKAAEPRLWGRFASWVYRLLNWKGIYWSSAAAVRGADQAAESFFSAGIERWSREGRLASEETATLKRYLDSKEVQGALRHLGAHLVLSAIFRFPFGSILRLAWTVSFWGKLQMARFRRSSEPAASAGPNIHNPVVMLLSVIPGFGAVAYLASRPLRRKLLVRLLLDQIAWKLPFRLHARMRLGRILAPPVARAAAARRPATHSRQAYPRAEASYPLKS